MFAARVRASLKPFLHGRHISYLSRNCEIAANSRRVLLDRFNDGDWTQTSLRLTGNGVGTKFSHRAFHSSSPQCYSSESDVGVNTHTTALFSSLEDDMFSELGSVEKDRNQEMVVELLTKVPDTFQVEKPELSQKTKSSKKKKKKKKKHEQASDSISKPKLLTEKPEASWKTNGKSKAETHASSPARNVTDSISKLSSPISDHESKAQNITSLGSEAKNETSYNGSSTSNTPSNHPSLVLVIRIGNVNSKTTDSEIHSRCLSIGSLEGLVRVDEHSADVLFRAENMNEANSILEKLNDATIDQSQWTAEIVPEAEEASIDQMGARINSSFEDMEEQLKERQILVKDLEVMVHSIIHLENHPMAREACVSPSIKNAEETLNTLRYANCARNIQNKAVVQKLKSPAFDNRSRDGDDLPSSHVFSGSFDSLSHLKSFAPSFDYDAMYKERTPYESASQPVYEKHVYNENDVFDDVFHSISSP